LPWIKKDTVGLDPFPHTSEYLSVLHVFIRFVLHSRKPQGYSWTVKIPVAGTYDPRQDSLFLVPEIGQQAGLLGMESLQYQLEAVLRSDYTYSEVQDVSGDFQFLDKRSAFGDGVVWGISLKVLDMNVKLMMRLESPQRYSH
jgi:hypothetical protein